jgi:nucleoid-associated protein YgaU
VTVVTKFCFRLAALSLLLARPALALDPSEIILSVQGAYARALSPDRYGADTQGNALYAQLEQSLSPQWSVGLGLSQVSLRDGSANNYSFNSLQILGRRWFGRWHGFNPYLQMGLGGNLFKEAFKNPFGDVFEAHWALGSTYVLDTFWAINYGVSWHVIAPLNTPHQYAAARLGLSYRFGTQPHVNRISPPPVQATAMEPLNRDKVKEVVGKVEYTVQLGDNLYSIAGNAGLLGRPSLWPLIYESNKGQIKDPNLIQPKQVLVIRRNYSPEEAAEALKAATATPTPDRVKAVP